MFLHGQPGNGTNLTFGAATGTAVTINDCNTNNKRQATQMAHLSIYGTNATTTNGGVTLVLAGGTNGACATTLDDLTLKYAAYGLITASNTYEFSLSNSMVGSNFRDLWQKTPDNSGESMIYVNDKFVDPALATSGGTASSTGCVYLDSNSSPSTIFLGDSIDDCGVYIAAGNLTVNFDGVHFENPAPQFYNTYDFVYAATSIPGTSVNFFGGTMMQDATSSNTGGAVPEFVSNGALMNFQGTTFDRNGSSATGTTHMVNYLAGSNAIVNVKDLNLVNTPFTGTAFGATTLPVTGGNFESNANSYLAGWSQSATNQYQFYQGGGVAATFGIPTGDSNANGMTFFVGGTQTGSSTIDDGGSFACSLASTAFSSTFAGPIGGTTNGTCFLEFAATAAASGTFTLPPLASSTNRIYWISNSSAFNLVIQGSATTTDIFKQIGTAATSTSFNMASNTRAMIQGDAVRSYWLRMF